MLGESVGYITPREVEHVKRDLVGALISSKEVVDEYNTYQKKLGSSVFYDDFHGLASLVDRATPVLWRTDLWDAATSGSALFQSEIHTIDIDELMPSPSQLHIPAATKQYVSLDTKENLFQDALFLPKEPALTALYITKTGPLILGDGRLENLLAVVAFFIPFVPLMDRHKVETAWTRVRTFYVAKDQVSHVLALNALALLSFMQQKYVKVESNAFDRAERRRCIREGRKVPDIRVVYLRQKSKVSHEPGHEIDWQYQWTVRGHWRNQWYASEGRHKPAWIGEFLKGPEGKPLKPHVQKSVYYVSR